MFLTNLKYTLALPILRGMAKTPLYRFSTNAQVMLLPDIQHEPLHPIATYAPWRTDNEFLKAYVHAKGNTLVDIYRCFDLWSLLEQASKAGAGDILEVGVWRGGTGSILAKKAQLMNLSSKVYLADTFSGVVKAGPKDSGYVGGEHADTSLDLVKNFFKGLSLSAEFLKGIFPDQRPSNFDQKSFIFCHIDVDTYESGLSIFEWVWPRLLVGGIVVFDDHGFYRCAGVTRLCEELKKRKSLTYLYNLNGHGVFVKTQ
jgi:O-methyltransferase